MIGFMIPIAVIIGVIYCIISFDLYLCEKVKMQKWVAHLMMLLIACAIVGLTFCFIVPKYVAY